MNDLVLIADCMSNEPANGGGCVTLFTASADSLETPFLSGPAGLDAQVRAFGYDGIRVTQSLSYFRAGESPLRRDVNYLARLRFGLGLLLWTTLLSGGVIASCFLIAVDFPLGISIASIALLVCAVSTSICLGKPPTLTGPILSEKRRRRMMLFDGLALCGLVVLAVGGCVLQLLVSSDDRGDSATSFGFAGAAVAFFFFTVAVPRFRFFYFFFMCPVMLEIGGRKTAQHAVVLGWLKTISDGGLVACMFLAAAGYFIEHDLAIYPALGALCALGLWGVVWIYTWAVHIAAYRVARRAHSDSQSLLNAPIVQAELVSAADPR